MGWDSLIMAPLLSPTATLAGSCEKTIRIQTILGQGEVREGWLEAEDVGKDEVGERQIRR